MSFSNEPLASIDGVPLPNVSQRFRDIHQVLHPVSCSQSQASPGTQSALSAWPLQPHFSLPPSTRLPMGAVVDSAAGLLSTGSETAPAVQGTGNNSMRRASIGTVLAGPAAVRTAAAAVAVEAAAAAAAAATAAGSGATASASSSVSATAAARPGAAPHPPARLGTSGAPRAWSSGRASRAYAALSTAGPGPSGLRAHSSGAALGAAPGARGGPGAVLTLAATPSPTSAAAPLGPVPLVPVLPVPAEETGFADSAAAAAAAALEASDASAAPRDDRDAE